MGVEEIFLVEFFRGFMKVLYSFMQFLEDFVMRNLAKYLTKFLEAFLECPLGQNLLLSSILYKHFHSF